MASGFKWDDEGGNKEERSQRISEMKAAGSGAGSPVCYGRGALVWPTVALVGGGLLVWVTP